MSRIHIAGLGAVSPAGWGLDCLREAVGKGEPLPSQPLERPGLTPLSVRPVPDPASKLPFLAHPRARRVSPVTQYAAAAALAALEAVPAEARAGRIALVFCLQSGPVRYASRFFQEVQQDPATASPLLFPETVFSAPASHVAALIGNVSLAYTLLSDPAGFLRGLALAAEWLENGRADLCLVVGAEEFNWLHAEAVRHFDRDSVPSAGAGAVCLSARAGCGPGACLEAVTDAHTYSRRVRQAQAVAQMRRQLPRGGADELLCDSQGGCYAADLAEREAWRDWPGARVSPKRVLGEGLMAAAGWQVVLAADAVASGEFSAAQVSLVGCHQQAIGARFGRG